MSSLSSARGNPAIDAPLEQASIAKRMGLLIETGLDPIFNWDSIFGQMEETVDDLSEHMSDLLFLAARHLGLALAKSSRSEDRYQFMFSMGNIKKLIHASYQQAARRNGWPGMEVRIPAETLKGIKFNFYFALHHEAIGIPRYMDPGVLFMNHMAEELVKSEEPIPCLESKEEGTVFFEALLGENYKTGGFHDSIASVLEEREVDQDMDEIDVRCGGYACDYRSELEFGLLELVPRSEDGLIVEGFDTLESSCTPKSEVDWFDDNNDGEPKETEGGNLDLMTQLHMPDCLLNDTLIPLVRTTLVELGVEDTRELDIEKFEALTERLIPAKALFTYNSDRFFDLALNRSPEILHADFTKVELTTFEGVIGFVLDLLSFEHEKEPVSESIEEVTAGVVACMLNKARYQEEGWGIYSRLVGNYPKFDDRLGLV